MFVHYSDIAFASTLTYNKVTARATALNTNRRKGSMKMPNAGEIIERLARENERQKIEIEQLKHRIRDLEHKLTEKAD